MTKSIDNYKQSSIEGKGKRNGSSPHCDYVRVELLSTSEKD
jgi:hypothetical protein